MGERCGQNQPNGRRQRQKQARRQAGIDKQFRQADIRNDRDGDGEQNGKRLAFTETLKREINKDQRAACTKKTEAHPFRQTERW